MRQEAQKKHQDGSLTSSMVFPKVSTTDYGHRHDTEPGGLANTAALLSSEEQIES